MTDTAITRTGVIGLGAMGLQMARHMVAKGFEVAGTDIDPEAMRRAGAHGVRLCESAIEVGDRADIVVLMVATDAQVNDLVRASGLLDRLRPGAVICIASSIAPQTCRDLAAVAAARNIGMLDTPVVLGQEAANNGELTIYVGGEARWVERATPALAAFGRKIIHVGAIGNGQIAKTMNNMLLWACMCANFEVLTLAKSLGADVPKLIEALGHGSGANWSLSRWGTGTGKWAEKDMDVALDIAQHAKVPMPLAGLVDQLVKSINQDKMKALLASGSASG
jgi:3-hydroxyisobutyrate dehydrogenase-like beta-hydroxyacid dehydrogenase